MVVDAWSAALANVVAKIGEGQESIGTAPGHLPSGVHANNFFCLAAAEMWFMLSPAVHS